MLFLRLLILSHFDSKQQLYINLNVSKEFEFNVYVYHIKSDLMKFSLNFISWSDQKKTEFILFLSCLLSDVETQYWFTELEIAEIVWIVKKIHHIIKTAEKTTIIYINYFAAVFIVCQLSLNIINIKKLNLYLVYAFKYLQCFCLNVHYKLSKINIISNTLSQLASHEYQLKLNKFSFDVLHSSMMFIYANNLVEMSSKFHQCVFNSYIESYSQ